MYPTKPINPNLDDYDNFLTVVVGIPAAALSPSVADPTTPAALSETPGGALDAVTYFVTYTYTNANGETLPSPEASLAVDASNLLVVASPDPSAGATAWNVYVSTASGVEALQASGMAIGSPWAEPSSGLIQGVYAPNENTTYALAIQMSFQVALETVNTAIAQASCQIYALAVYNLAADRLLNYANDLPGQSYFTNLRKDWNLTAPVVGVASSGSDAGTSSSWLNPKQLETLTLSDLQTLKTPYGRQYLGFAQAYGTLWGLT